VVASCGGQGALTLARQACGYVNTSILQYEESQTAKTEKQKLDLENEAYNTLQLGLQPAALATSDDNQWQALMSTISESSRVSEAVLVSALQQQCAVADLDGGQEPAQGTSPTTTTPGTSPSTTSDPGS
jgi:hypothetical protein